MRRFLAYLFGIAVIMSVLSSCGGSGSKVYIYIPVDGSGNPFEGLFANRDTAAIYFRFRPLESGFTALDESSVIPGQQIWYPDPSSRGLSPFNEIFDLDSAEVGNGVLYLVEIYGKNDYRTPGVNPATDFQYYGYPDCPLVVGGAGDNRVNLCFGYYTSSVRRLCSGMQALSSCIY